ncbi:hypothetical protein [Sphingobacterium multivorum]|uniref:DUF3127 domain-containing protein n=1 Tax=Sphingobacterium multivorum TaxID=28454 RepID=A0A653YSQ0_SPHMU|nr:hypothetical protein [Sphingobacterium multivorum]VXC45346.1 conserved hypothetical protein [Sphingobacterium multivorum]
MATTSFKGIVEKTEISNYGEGEKAGKRQSIVVMVPGWTDSYGEKKGPDEKFQIDQFNDNIEKNPITTSDIGRKIDVEVYLKGREFDRNDGGKGYAVGLNIKSFKLGDRLYDAPEVEEDDLPF